MKISTISNSQIFRLNVTFDKLNERLFTILHFLLFFLTAFISNSIYAQCSCGVATAGIRSLVSEMTTTTWSGGGPYCLNLRENFHVFNNEHVTWTNCTVKIDSGVKITINVGGSLTISNNCTVTRNGSSCSNWQGFVVAGTGNSTDQSPTTNQGYLVIDGSTIEYANLAVDVQSGGILKVSNSGFIYNTQDINIDPYSQPGNIHENECEFIETSFSTLDLDGSTRVIMTDIEGVNFYACTFQNNADWNNATLTTDMGTGILASDCRFQVTGSDYSTDEFGCFESHTNGSYFTNFSSAIVTSTSGGSIQDLPVIIQDATFFKNFYGINCTNGEDLTITNCTFNTNQGGTPPPIWQNGFINIILNYNKSSTFQYINFNSFNSDIDYNALNNSVFCFVRTYGTLQFIKNSCSSVDYAVVPAASSKIIGLYLEDAANLIFVCNSFANLHHDLYNISSISQIGNTSYEHTNTFSTGTYSISNIASLYNFDYFKLTGTTSPNIPIPNGGGTNITLQVANINNTDCSGCPILIGEESRPGFSSEKLDQKVKISRITKNLMELSYENMDYSGISSIDIYDILGSKKETITDIDKNIINFKSEKNGLLIILIHLNNGTMQKYKVYVNYIDKE